VDLVARTNHDGLKCWWALIFHLRCHCLSEDSGWEGERPWFAASILRGVRDIGLDHPFFELI